ncbi:MAG TPA: CHAT domain-containing tetratricopeptide repeat protein [Ktedonobacteraceae bacterium]|nr:CHAT domain-containing tetratricopeptide repeat protein [Ktedonobacteraceae bacterium]
MESDLFLERLRVLPLEEGRLFIQYHISELSDHKAVGELLAEEALRVLYTPFLSLKLAELLIFYGDYTSHLPSHALGLKAKGDALVGVGHNRAAMEASDAAEEEFLRLGDEGNRARSRISWVLACAWLGQSGEALKVAARARAVFMHLGEPYWVCVIDNNIAMIMGNMGQNEDAVRLYENMLAIYPTVTGQSKTFIQRSIALAQLNQAVHLFWLGDFEQAYSLQQKALASFNTLNETDLAIRVEKNLAELDYTQGYYGSALRRYYQARERLMQSDEDNTLLLAMLKVYMANCLVKLDRMQEACRVSEEAVEAYRKVGMSQSIGNALHQHAITLVAAGKLKEALTVLDEAWNLFKNGGFEPLAYLAKLHQAEILLEMGSATSAYDLAHSIKYYFDSQGLMACSVRVSLVIVGVLIEKAQNALLEREKQPGRVLEEAIGLCKETMSQARLHDLQEEVYKSHYLMGRIFALQNDLQKTARHYQIAIAQIERMLGNLVHDLSPSFLRTTWAIYEEMIMLCLQQDQPEKAFSYLERARSFALRQHLNKMKLSLNKEEVREEPLPNEALRIQLELKDWQESHRFYSTLLAEIDTSVSPALDKAIIEKELKQCEAKVNELFERLHLHQVTVNREDHRSPSSKPIKTKERLLSAQEIDPAWLRQHLSPDQLLLTYYLHKKKLIIFALTTDRMFMYENPEGAGELENLLPLLHAHLQTGGWPDLHNPPQKTIRRLLNKLYTLLIAPVNSLLPSLSGHLVIVPYGPLHKLPFHALYDGERFLIENFQVSYLPASSLLSRLDTSGSELDDCSVRGEHAAKPPLVFGFSENGQLQRVHDEARNVASLLGGNCYLEKDATIANLIQQAPSTPLIHLATHGKSRLDAPNFSYVRLADGQLNAIDAFSLDLVGCELVTLSGCETGLALSSGGDEQLGLGRAFLAAGANSLIISLWPVEDNATSELMKLFYQHLLHGESKVQALRAAQCHFLRQDGSMPDLYTHPYFWAAFRLVGDIRPLKYLRP